MESYHIRKSGKEKVIMIICLWKKYFLEQFYYSVEKIFFGTKIHNLFLSKFTLTPKNTCHNKYFFQI